MKTKRCKMKQGCCLVTFCPLVPRWATTITVKVGAPSGAAAYNVQGSILHRLLGINVSRLDKKVTDTALENLQERLKHLLCLIIDE